MNESSKAWLNVAHFDNLTTTVAQTRRGTWQKLEVSVSGPGVNNNNGNNSGIGSGNGLKDANGASAGPGNNDIATKSESCKKNEKPTVSSAITKAIQAAQNKAKSQNEAKNASNPISPIRGKKTDIKITEAVKTTSESTSKEGANAATTSTKSSTTTDAASAGGNGTSSSSSSINSTEITITIQSVNEMSKIDCLVFQNWYSSEFSLYQIQPWRSEPTKMREKLIYSSQLVNNPSYDDDQQSYFAIYRSQFDTTEFLEIPNGQEYVTLKMKLRQESPVWHNCSIRNVLAFRFMPETPGAVRVEKKDVFSRGLTSSLVELPGLFDAYGHAYDTRYRFSPHDQRPDIIDVCPDPNYVRK